MHITSIYSLYGNNNLPGPCTLTHQPGCQWQSRSDGHGPAVPFPESSPGLSVSHWPHSGVKFTMREGADGPSICWCISWSTSFALKSRWWMTFCTRSQLPPVRTPRRRRPMRLCGKEGQDGARCTIALVYPKNILYIYIQHIYTMYIQRIYNVYTWYMQSIY
jgi:hypothetical protein